MSARQQKKRDRDTGGKEGVEGGFEALIPVTVGDGETEVEQLSEDDAVLIVRGEQRRKKMILVKPRREQLQAFGVPLVPLGQRHAVAIKHGPAHAQDEGEETQG